MSSSRRRSRSRGGAKPKPKPYKFKARPAPKTNVKSSFSELKRIVDMPLAAGLAQVESGFRVRSLLSTNGGFLLLFPSGWCEALKYSVNNPSLVDLFVCLSVLF